MGLFAPGQMRTDTAVCETEVEIAAVTEDKLWELFYQNPEFGAYLLRIIVQRSAIANGLGPPSIIKV
jgi:CRP-like cAMP-binding protein